MISAARLTFKSGFDWLLASYRENAMQEKAHREQQCRSRLDLISGMNRGLLNDRLSILNCFVVCSHFSLGDMTGWLKWLMED